MGRMRTSFEGSPHKGLEPRVSEALSRDVDGWPQEHQDGFDVALAALSLASFSQTRPMRQGWVGAPECDTPADVTLRIYEAAGVRLQMIFYPERMRSPDVWGAQWIGGPDGGGFDPIPDHDLPLSGDVWKRHVDDAAPGWEMVPTEPQQVSLCGVVLSELSSDLLRRIGHPQATGWDGALLERSAPPPLIHTILGDRVDAAGGESVTALSTVRLATFQARGAGEAAEIEVDIEAGPDRLVRAQLLEALSMLGLGAALSDSGVAMSRAVDGLLQSEAAMVADLWIRIRANDPVLNGHAWPVAGRRGPARAESVLTLASLLRRGDGGYVLRGLRLQQQLRPAPFDDRNGVDAMARLSARVRRTRAMPAFASMMVLLRRVLC